MRLLQHLRQALGSGRIYGTNMSPATHGPPVWRFVGSRHGIPNSTTRTGFASQATKPYWHPQILSPKISKQYKHQPLSRPRQIRVLELAPAMRLQDPIDCRLVETSLPADATTGGTLDYEALSYVWGSPTGDRPILCEDGVILVTENCESALRYLRDRYRSRQLWIDSVCIDQTSDEEKAQQVPLMGDVYRLARRTIIWLGEGNERSIAGMNYVQIISWIPGRWLKTKFSKTWNCKRPALRQFCH